MRTTINGFIETGSWVDIVEHGEKVTAALEEIDVESDYSSAIGDWEKWRPKPHEQLREEVTKKTAKQAAISKSEREQAGDTPDEDLKRATEEFKKSVEVKERGPKVETARWKKAVQYTMTAISSILHRILQNVEIFTYTRIMTAISPCYFDTQLISANLSRSTRGGELTYRLEINITDEKVKDEVEEKLERYHSDINRWHITGPIDSKDIEASEGLNSVEKQEDTEVDINSNLSQKEHTDD